MSRAASETPGGRHAKAEGFPPPTSAEHARLAESPNTDDPWRLWGPYLSGRQWGTVREDYSADGDAWAYFPFEQSHARAYRWGEDGLGGFCDRFGFLNFSVALWNGRDPILKERLYGLTNAQGNHGEDVKEYFWALDGTPTHSYAQWLYRYPQGEYPYAELRESNASRGRDDREFELADTGILEQNRFFDVTVTYAKAAPDDICITVSAINHGPDPAELHLLPQIWFHNTWAWGTDDRCPTLTALDPEQAGANLRVVDCRHAFLGRYVLSAAGEPQVLVCDNETNARELFAAAENRTSRTTDGIGARVVNGDETAAATSGSGTKAAFWYHFPAVPPGETVTVQLRLDTVDPGPHTFGPGFAAVQDDRRTECADFYRKVLPDRLSDEDAGIARRAFAGLLWGKQLYRYDVGRWLDGDPGQPPSPPERAAPNARNTAWRNLSVADVMSMPDEWEYPWFASWDLAFHCVALAHIDPAFAKNQLLLLCREWLMHPDGQLPAYEWAFGDVNPPVHAWAAWQVYVSDGSWDTDFLVRICTKLMLNFAWWINRKDVDGSNLFEGGFLGMDNIGLFNRSEQLPAGFRLEQSDATSWMAFFCLQMLRISLEIAAVLPAFDDTATKFLEHFLSIALAMRDFGSGGVHLWDETDGFYYDVLVHPDGSTQPLRVRSMVGLLPLLAVAPVPAETVRFPDFASRLAWLQSHRPELLAGLVKHAGPGEDRLFSLVDASSLARILTRVFDEAEFLSPHGIRSLSAAYAQAYSADVGGTSMTIDYEPGESRSDLFGGNSNWRGPVWFPVNLLLADSLRRYAEFYGDGITVAAPDGPITLAQAATQLDDRLIALFRRGRDGRRPSDGARIEASPDPLWSAHPTFYEYFDGDTGEGLGATHQTGWTALVAHLLCAPGDDPGQST